MAKPRSTSTEQPSVAPSIGDYQFPKITFPNLDEVFTELQGSEFRELSARKKFHRVNQSLLQLILAAPKCSFLLPAVVEYIERVNSLHLLGERFHISLFEFWLNNFSELTEEANYAIRGKIAGKSIPRDDYQIYFPIGMNKVYPGTHFVAAHLSPDVDTMVASFWGWVDAFAARVGSARHIWSLPGGPPESPVTQSFKEMFGKSAFANLSSSTPTLTLAAIDLLTQQGFVKKKGNSSISTLDLSSSEKAVILVDDQGHYVGDWHNVDSEPVRKIILRFKSCLRWFENNLHVQLITLFAQKKLHVRDIPPFLSSIFDVAIRDCEPAREFTERQKKDLHDFLFKVLGLKEGLNSTFRELNQAFAQLSVYDLIHFQKEVESLQTSTLFDASGYLREDRPAIFTLLEKIINQLDHAIYHVRDYAEHLDVAWNIKSKVIGIPPLFLTMRSDVEEIRLRMKKHEYLTVVIPEMDGQWFPVGVVWSNTLQQQILGTVTFRDFCNQEEVKMASYLTPISVIDHHKTSLKTAAPPMAIISDAQSCNVLLGEKAFAINARYSLGGMTTTEIKDALQEMRDSPHTPRNVRMLQRLLQRQIAVDFCGESYFVHPDRELAEYYCFLHAILDDTDLLTKVSTRDIECVCELLNRIKSLLVKRDVEVIDLSGIPRDQNFAKTAAKQILTNPEMYSFYRKVYESKEQEIENNLKAVDEGQFNALFADTKEQNGCCRVGQLKLFSVNFPFFIKQRAKLLNYWVKNAQTVHQDAPEIDFHLQMISTVPSAEEVYENHVGKPYKHQDELWFWVPSNQRAFDHLTSFISSFQSVMRLGPPTTLEFGSSAIGELKQLFSRYFPNIPQHIASETSELPVVILHFKAGMLNSRKAAITPYLPKLIT